MIQQAAVGLEETKIGAHYWHLLRKGEEPLRVFLLREDKVHDDMLRALQRLHGEQELVFDDSDTNLEKLKTFGIFQGCPWTIPSAEAEGEGTTRPRKRTPTGTRTWRSRGDRPGARRDTRARAGVWMRITGGKDLLRG